MVRRKQNKGKSATAQPRPVTVKSMQPVSRYILRVSIAETLAPIGTVSWFNFDEPVANHPILKNFTQYRIKRVGLMVPPKSYVEFIVRGELLDGINTRRELTCQPDCQMVHVWEGEPRTYWYAPTEAIYRGWQDVIAPGGNLEILTGMHFAINGDNTLTPGSDGLLCWEVIDIEVKGVNTTYIGINSTAEGKVPISRTTSDFEILTT